MQLLRTYSKILLLWLFAVNVYANNQEGSLNTYHGENSVANSNNSTKDDSVSNTYNGAGSSSEIPVGSAISPSYMSNGMDTCLKGTGGSLQTVGVGFSSGGYNVDPECNRRRDAKVLSDLNMKVAAVARMCQSVDVWKSMFISGTPCPILSNGKLIVGKRAFLMMKQNPKTYIPDYGKTTREWYNTILKIGESDVEEEDDDFTSISAKYRSSLQ
jgi:hypothetical protein